MSVEFGHVDMEWVADAGKLAKEALYGPHAHLVHFVGGLEVVPIGGS